MRPIPTAFISFESVSVLYETDAYTTSSAIALDSVNAAIRKPCKMCCVLKLTDICRRQTSRAINRTPECGFWMVIFREKTGEYVKYFDHTVKLQTVNEDYTVLSVWSQLLADQNSP